MQGALILWSFAIAALVIAIGTGIYDTVNTRRRAKQMENVRPIDWSAPKRFWGHDAWVQAEMRAQQEIADSIKEHAAHVEFNIKMAQLDAMREGRKTAQRTEPDNYRDEL